MDFKQLQSFEAVVKNMSFTKAAQKLFLSQPTVSAHVSALEEELGKRLILRTTKSIELTPKGAEVYEYAVRILDLRDRMIVSCAPQSQNIIHIGASTIPSAYILPELLAEFGTLSPDTYFSIHQSDSRDVVEGLLEGLFDIGMVGEAISDERIVCTPFCEDHVIIITPVNEHFLQLARQEASALPALLKEPMIMRETGSQKMADRLLESMGLNGDSLNIIARVNDQEAIKNMVASGLGISLISELAAKNLLAEKRILSFRLPEFVSSRKQYLVYRQNYILSPDIRKLLKFISDKYGCKGESYELDQ